jgi:HAD superfamily hydrolase (TIGR01484 family)
MTPDLNFLALALDYDGTLASVGRVRKSTFKALETVAQSGRKLVLVSGRQLEDLLEVFPQHDLFEWIVVENGALLYCPRTRETRLLAEPVPEGFPEALRQRGVSDVAVGRSVVATWRPHECTVLEVLRDLGLDRQIIFNKNAVMVLPTGVNKASGLAAALGEMKISHHNVAAIGDAENDLPMLGWCECGVAVSNALESVKAKADFVTNGDHGAGVEESIRDLIDNDLEARLQPDRRRGLLLGVEKDAPERSVSLPALGHSVLVAGPSGSGKSTAITGVLERMAAAGYQFCIFDPEGDYERFESAVTLGNPHCVPGAGEVLDLMERMHSAAVNMLGVSLDNRPVYVAEVVRKLETLRAAKGRPHWFVFDEAHHVFPADFPAGTPVLEAPPATSLMITVHPPHVRKEALCSADIVIAVGKDPDETIRNFCRSAGAEAPRLHPVTLDRSEALVWFRGRREPVVVAVEPGKSEHRRHIRKYAEGDLGPGSFVFRGPEGKLNLAAHNLSTFIRMASGVDDETWNWHLRAHDYSRWFHEVIRDDALAEEAEALENVQGPAGESRERIFAAIRGRYTAPA